MPAPTPGTKVVGAAMVAADVRSDLDGFRSFVNGDTGLSASDVTAASIGKEQVYRPEHLGFPVSGSEGATQAVYSTSRLASGHYTSLEWERLTDRRSIFNRTLNDDSSMALPWLSKTIELPGSSWVRASASFSARVVYDWYSSGNPEHVSGTVGSPAVANAHIGGEFELVYRSRATGAETTFHAIRSVQNPYVGVATVGMINLHRYFYSMSFAATISAGTYDVYVKFTKSAASTYNSPYQITFSATNLLIEADF